MADAALNRSRLIQSRMERRRSDAPTPLGTTGAILDLPDNVIPFNRSRASTSVGEPRALDNRQSVANNNLYFQNTQARQAIWNQTRAANRIQSNIALPATLSNLSPEEREDPAMKQVEREFRTGTANVIQRDRTNSLNRRSRLQTQKNLQEKRKDLENKVAKVRSLIKKAKYAKDVAWTTYEILSLAESEGAMAETVNTSGIFISIYRGLKTFLMPQAQFSKDPDAGQVFKGFLSFVEPTALIAKRPTAWIAGMHAIYGYFLLGVLFMIFIAIMRVLIIKFI